jgi:uncharacterized protein (TIGR01777 family)
MSTFANRRIVVTGATGLVGSLLCTKLEREGATVIRAVRRAARGDGELSWNPETGEMDSARLAGVHGVVHLAGENIAGRRWTAAFKERIRDSRLRGTRTVGEAIARANPRPAVFVCASAIGYYGDRGDEIMTETSAPADDFLGQVCRDWEAACQAARDAGVRTVNARIGVVLSPAGGALKKMLPPFKMGAGGVMGSGRQYMSWVAIDDVVGAVMFALANESVAGPVNVTSPNPATNREFTKTLGRVLARPTVFPMPALAAKVLFGEMAEALLLSSTRVSPQALSQAGYRFQFPELEAALRGLLLRG